MELFNLAEKPQVRRSAQSAELLLLHLRDPFASEQLAKFYVLQRQDHDNKNILDIDVDFQLRLS